MKLDFTAKPTIIINLVNESLEKDIEHLLLGIEEEGLPYEIKVNHTCSDSVALAYDASVESSLLVGIGCDNNEIVLHYRNLKQHEFVYKVGQYKQKSKDVLRILGSNAARLVKGNPFTVCEDFESSF